MVAMRSIAIAIGRRGGGEVVSDGGWGVYPPLTIGIMRNAHSSGMVKKIVVSKIHR